MQVDDEDMSLSQTYGTELKTIPEKQQEGVQYIMLIPEEELEGTSCVK